MDLDGIAGQQPGPQRMRSAVLATAIAVLLWNIDFLAPALFPLRLLVTFAHEAGHGLAAIITGGDFLRFEISANGSGLAWTSGGWRWVVLPAGYIGAALSASVLLLSAHRATDPRKPATVLAVVIGFIAVFFGWSSVLALVAGLGTAAALLALARLATIPMTVLALDVVALLMGWSSVIDLVSILRSPDIGLGQITNDAAAFGDHLRLGGTRVWAFLWLLVVLGLLWTAARAALSSDREELA